MRELTTRWATAVERLTSRWAEPAQKIWATHWLLILGAFCVFASVILKWIDFPFSRHPSGLQLPLLRNVGLLPRVCFFSYGLVASAILTTALVLCRRSGQFLALAAAILITLCVMLPFQIAFQQPAFLGRLIAEAQDLGMIRGFTKDYLPINYGDAEGYSTGFDFTTIWGRFTAAYSFLGLGWYCFGIGSLLIAICSIDRLRGERGTLLPALASIPIGVVLILLTPCVIGQHYFTRARAVQAEGDNQKAIQNYRKAIWWDGWRARDLTIYAIIGDLETLSGSSADSAEKHISRAKEFKAAREYDSAVFELSQAAEWGGPVAIAARHESARIRAHFGTALYAGGGIGAALSHWQQAIIENPVPQEALAFLIARGNYDLGRYEAALEAVNRVLRVCSDSPVRANAYSIAGDCYVELGRDVDARKSYNRSLAADMDANFWGMSRLIGH